MNREIKFRNAFLHKDGSFSHFCYWGAINTKGEPLSDDGCFVSPSSSNGLDKQWHQQYTGLKDKNGKEIYEGDIIDINQTVNGQSKFLIKGCLPFMDVRYLHDNRPYEYTIHDLLDAYRDEKEIEIIGNIYENTTLLQ